MCGIAGLIHRDGVGNIGQEMTAMLQSLKHRGPDSTGFALYGRPGRNEFVMRFKETGDVFWFMLPIGIEDNNIFCS